MGRGLCSQGAVQGQEPAYQLGRVVVVATAWQDLGIAVVVATAWQDLGRVVVVAAAWQDLGIAVIVAAAWQDLGRVVAVAAAWQDLNIAVVVSTAWQDLGNAAWQQQQHLCEVGSCRPQGKVYRTGHEYGVCSSCGVMEAKMAIGTVLVAIPAGAALKALSAWWYRSSGRKLGWFSVHCAEPSLE
jgi:hypothetical protein